MNRARVRQDGRGCAAMKTSMNAITGQIIVMKTRFVLIQTAVTLVCVRMDTQEMDSSVPMLMSVANPHTVVVKMLCVETQTVTTRVDVLMDIQEMASRVKTSMSVRN